jgi:hypothetical protein
MIAMSNSLAPSRLDRFIQSVLESERHFLSPENMDFLERLHEASHTRIKVIPENAVYFRARINENPDQPIPKEQMVPVPGLRSEGRVNPYNVNVLYLSNKPGVAVAEVRPGLFEPTTVASFRIKKDVRVIDFTTGDSSRYDKKNLDEEMRIWIELNKCFSTSFTSSETRLNYIPTQIISEFFKSKGLDGVMYQSQFDLPETASDAGDLNINIALFDMNTAEAMETRLYQIHRQIITVKTLD